MDVILCENDEQLGQQAAEAAAALIFQAIDERNEANLVAAGGMSQFSLLASLVVQENIDWSSVVAFNLHEYRGLSASHPASFHRDLKERLVDQVPIKEFYHIDGQLSATEECRRLTELIGHKLIDVTFVGIGENGHLAFNNPPADFTTTKPYLVVDLDDTCRRQQLGEGWFTQLNDVPRQAISMSIRKILASRAIVCCVPDRRKVEAVRASLEGPVTPDVPASILQQHPRASVYLNQNSLSLSDPDKYPALRWP